MTRKPHLSTLEFAGRLAHPRVAAVVVDARRLHLCVDAICAPGPAPRDTLAA